MKKALIAIGTTAGAIAIAAVMVTAQAQQSGGANTSGQQVGPQARGGRGQMGRGAGLGPRGFGPGLGRDLAELKLTEEQRSKIGEIHRAERERVQPVETELRSTQRALHAQLFADTRDAGKTAELAAKISALQKQLTDLHVQTATSVAELLTAEQRATMRAREGRDGRPGPGRGRFGPGGDRRRLHTGMVR